MTNSQIFKCFWSNMAPSTILKVTPILKTLKSLNIIIRYLLFKNYSYDFFFFFHLIMYSKTCLHQILNKEQSCVNHTSNLVLYTNMF